MNRSVSHASGPNGTTCTTLQNPRIAGPIPAVASRIHRACSARYFGRRSLSTILRETQRQPCGPERSHNAAAKQDEQSADDIRYRYRAVARKQTQETQPIERGENEPEKRPTPRERSLRNGDAARPIRAEAGEQQEGAREPARR